MCVCVLWANACKVCSQELLKAVEQQRRVNLNPTRNLTIFCHPTLADFELHHLPVVVVVNGSALEDRIIKHLPAATAMGRTQHHMGRREGSRNQGSTGHICPQCLVFSANPNGPSGGISVIYSS
ncbi:hypothetical protein E3N88_29524 [Mikania micrantha]|uniref:Uncharacterized protein n=1 Tax=Mikania micrantha TaxID=192012 RepID=A0A5N6MJ22_9ASTR|nr:hypothetical protein E3N88_29524 [Mikania micrantha]